VIVAGTQRGPLLIARRRDLEQLLLSNREQRWSAVELDLSELSRRECEEWAARLNRHYLACGCDEGAAAAVLSLGCCLAVMRRRQPIALVSVGRRVVTGFAVAVASAAIGRSVGIGQARRRLRAETWLLEAVLANRAPPPSHGSATHVHGRATSGQGART